MKKFFLFIFLTMSIFGAYAQSASIDALERDFPKLMDLYRDSLGKCNAHYVFAIDISSSMLPFESAVKNNFLTFVTALPDGDEVTLIKMASTGQTDFVNNCRSIKLNAKTRENFVNIIYSPQFDFIKGGLNDGSDGYTMVEKVVDAVNVIGNNDLVFVYFFTDFEYWTKDNGYDKTKVDWRSLKRKLTTRSNYSMYKYGLELNFNNKSLRQDAIFKEELDDIFGAIEYQGVSNAAFLSQWFNQLQTNVMAMKLHSIVKSDWLKFTNSIKSNTSLVGDDVILEVSSVAMPLAKGLRVKVDNQGDDFVPCEIGDVGVGDQKVKLGTLVPADKSWIPWFKNIGGGEAEIVIDYISDYDKEINDLRSRFESDDLVFSTNTIVNMPSSKVWNCVLPFWLATIIGVIIAVILVSVIYTFCIKLNKSWSVIIRRIDQDKGKNTEYSDQLPTPVEVHSTINRQPVGVWTLKLLGKKYNPLLFWKKTGYYIRIDSTTIHTVDLMDPDYPRNVKQTISTNNEVFLFPKGKVNNVILEIKDRVNTYIVDLS